MMEIVAAMGKCSSRSRAWHTTALLLLLPLPLPVPLLLLLPPHSSRRIGQLER